MLVIVGLSKSPKGTIRVSVARPQRGSRMTRKYASEREAAAVLKQIGVGVDAVNYYVFKLLPWVCSHEELSFPPMNIPQQELLLMGFRGSSVVEDAFTRKR